MRRHDENDGVGVADEVPQLGLPLLAEFEVAGVELRGEAALLECRYQPDGEVRAVAARIGYEDLEAAVVPAPSDRRGAIDDRSVRDLRGELKLLPRPQHDAVPLLHSNERRPNRASIVQV